MCDLIDKGEQKKANKQMVISNIILTPKKLTKFK